MAAVAEASDDLREAERCHLEAVARAGEDAGPWIALHRFYLDADRPTDAERIREQLDRRFPERVDPWLDSASYHAVRGRWTEAMSAWAHVLERQPRNAEVAARCALAALAADRPGAARELVERMPPHARAADPALTLSLVGAHLEEEDWALALRELDLLQPRGEQGAALRTLRGEILCRLGRSDEATAELEAAVELDPSLARAHATLGRIRLAEGRTHAGVRALQRAVALAPGDGVSHGLLAARLAADGDLPLAARHLAAARRCDGARRLSARVEQMFPELAPLTADPSYR
jgi:tetratricopeptide (TPR) repeat protein